MTMASDTRESNFENQYVGNKAKGRISKRVFQENKACQISRKTNISYPLIRTRVWVAFLQNLACFIFLKHSFQDWPFCIVTDDSSSDFIFGSLQFVVAKCDRHYQMVQLFYCKLQQKFITTSVRIFLTKWHSIIIICYNSFITKCDVYYKICRYNPVYYVVYYQVIMKEIW